jgi:acyl-coenzyme A synthetase/AMP-(fatty) acid ligase/SAM-dependent methyltransferase
LNISILPKLCCAGCRVPYQSQIVLRIDDQIETGLLSCPKCLVTIPILRGFPLFDEQFLIRDPDLAELDLRFFGEKIDYLKFLHTKQERPVYDLYAAFQPFNESTQCISPLIPLLREHVRPGGHILDLWCRTGWTGELLSSLFPDQHVISIWESGSGLLGYKGFDFWLGSGRRRKNLDIIFHSPNFALPFLDDTFFIVHGLDTLHRYKHVPFISECLRVVTNEGVLVFPHNHLTNSQPEPFFERGEDQLHGLEYRKYFDEVLKGSVKKAFVLSEKTLFESRDEYQLKDEADTDHYNACILVTEERDNGRSFKIERATLLSHGDAYLILNPLWNVDWLSHKALPAPAAMDYGGQTLFMRHPMYESRLKGVSPVMLDEDDCLILYWAQRFKTVREIIAKLNKDSTEIFRKMERLQNLELLQIQNVSRSMAKLQSVFCTQKLPFMGTEATLSSLWERAVALHHNKPFLVWPLDDSVFTYADADTIVRKGISFLKSRGVHRGDRVLIDSVSHPEFVFVFWSAILLGAVVVPISLQWKPELVQHLICSVSPKLVMRAARLQKFGDEPSGPPSVLFAVPETDELYAGSYSEQISDYPVDSTLAESAEDQPAVILFTSGSSGPPKGVMLSDGALFRTSRLISDIYRWRSSDRFLGGGSFHTMSGLRNPCIAILHAGSSVVVPSEEDLQNPLNLIGIAVRSGATILNVTPNFFAYWNHAPHKANYFQNHKLRMALSTGSALHSSHRELFERYFGCPVFDYYGLTETSGVCILENIEMKHEKEIGIGKPYECLVKIVDGELSIYSDNLMLGYLNDEEQTRFRIRDGWFFTGDAAHINSSGFIVLKGRKDRMMIDKNGENVYPEQIERVINSLDGISESYVTDFHDENRISHIAALVKFTESILKPDLTVGKIQQALMARLPAQHVPEVIIPVQQIPKSANQKVSTNAVRKMIDEEFNGRESS